jgi:hypothetical protein
MRTGVPVRQATRVLQRLRHTLLDGFNEHVWKPRCQETADKDRLTRQERHGLTVRRPLRARQQASVSPVARSVPIATVEASRASVTTATAVAAVAMGAAAAAAPPVMGSSPASASRLSRRGTATEPARQATNAASESVAAFAAAARSVALRGGRWWQRRPDNSRVRLSGVGEDAPRRDAAADWAAAAFREHELHGGPKYAWQRADVLAVMRVDHAQVQQKVHTRKPAPVALEWSSGNTAALHVIAAEAARAEDSW